MLVDFETGETNMRRARTAVAAGFFSVTVALAGPVGAFGRGAPASPSIKTIGTPTTSAKPEIVPSLFVINSRGATLQGDTLVLIGVTPSSIIFADRPVRSAGHQPTADVIAEWGSGEDSFAKNPPNATAYALHQNSTSLNADAASPGRDAPSMAHILMALDPSQSPHRLALAQLE
jgi:hypothetical protein